MYSFVTCAALTGIFCVSLGPNLNLFNKCDLKQ